MLFVVGCLFTLCFTAQSSANLCLLSCNRGDTLSGVSCLDDYESSVDSNCPSGWTPKTSTTCTKNMCDEGQDSGIGSYYVEPSGTNTACRLSGNQRCMCYWGAPKQPAVSESGTYSCYWDDGGPTGWYTRLFDETGPWCYFNRKTVDCDGRFISKSGLCETSGFSNFWTCPGGGTLKTDGVTCRRTYPAVNLIGETRCGSSYAPSSTGCSWCGGITVCLPAGSTCYADCYAATANQATCTRLGSSCRWCGTSGSIGVCQPQSVACFSTCLAATADPSACGASSACKWCDTTSSIGVCQPKVGGVCYTHSVSACTRRRKATCAR